MKRTRLFTAIFAMALSVVALPAIASAQYGQYDPYGRNGGYNGNGQYGDMRSSLRNLKQHARQLERQIDRELDRSRYNGSYREDQINEIAHRFTAAVNNLDNSYNNRNDSEVRRVMNTASDLDRAISRSRLSPAVMNQWQAVRNDLRILGLGYGNNNGRGRGNGRYGNGGYNTGKPSWWPF